MPLNGLLTSGPQKDRANEIREVVSELKEVQLSALASLKDFIPLGQRADKLHKRYEQLRAYLEAQGRADLIVPNVVTKACKFAGRDILRSMELHGFFGAEALNAVKQTEAALRK